MQLTLAAQPRRAPNWGDPMFRGAGAGLVRMGAGVGEVYPAWWSEAGLADDVALQRAVDSCGRPACTVLLTRRLSLSQAVAMRPNAGIFATANAQLLGANGGTGARLWHQPGPLQTPSPLRYACLASLPTAAALAPPTAT